MCLKCRSTRLRIRRVPGIERILGRRDRREEDAYAVNRLSGNLRP
jgi:hypothetical protein